MESRLDRWLAPRRASREQDTAREIADDPTEVAWYRGASQIGTLTVKITDAPASAFSRRTTAQSSANLAAVSILAPARTMLRTRDRLQATGGEVWIVTAVSPDREVRTEAIGELAST